MLIEKFMALDTEITTGAMFISDFYSIDVANDKSQISGVSQEADELFESHLDKYHVY